MIRRILLSPGFDRAGAIFAGVVLVGGLAVLAMPSWSGVPDICRPGYARSQRLPPDRYYPIAKAAYERAGVPWSERHSHVLDHRRPICLGGDWSPSNLQVQTTADAAAKDRLEWKACREVCRGQLSIDTARGWFDDWRSAYRQQFGGAP